MLLSHYYFYTYTLYIILYLSNKNIYIKFSAHNKVEKLENQIFKKKIYLGAIKQKILIGIAKLFYGHLCLREEIISLNNKLH